MERLWGPVNGLYLAAYAAPAGDGEHFCSYAKVCWSQPDSYWDADCAFKIFGGALHRDPEEAIDWVAMEASHEIEHLSPQAKRLAEKRQRDHIPIPRLFVTSFFRHRIA